MTRPICTRTMPGRHLQPFVHSLTKLCRHTTLVQQCLSNGHQQISQCLSYTEPEDSLKARAYTTPKSRWKMVRILNHLVKTPAHPHPKVRKAGKGWQKKKKKSVKKIDVEEKKTMYLGRESIFHICFLCTSNYESFAIRIFLKVTLPIIK